MCDVHLLWINMHHTKTCFLRRFLFNYSHLKNYLKSHLCHCSQIGHIIQNTCFGMVMKVWEPQLGKIHGVCAWVYSGVVEKGNIHIKPQFHIMLLDLKQKCYLLGIPFANNEFMHKWCHIVNNKTSCKTLFLSNTLNLILLEITNLVTHSLPNKKIPMSLSFGNIYKVE